MSQPGKPDFALRLAIRFAVRPLSGAIAVLAVVLCLDLSVPMALGQSAPDTAEMEKLSEAARDALRGRSRPPWYDSSKDELQRVDLSPYRDKDTANRTSNWEHTPSGKRTSFFGNWTWWGGGRGGFAPSFGDLLQGIFWIVVGIILVALVALLVWAFLKAELPAGAGGDHSATDESEDVVTDADRIENLPFQVRRPQADMLGEARRHYEEGNYAEAIIYLFSYQLVQLDRCQLIHLTKGKTNRQYVREARRVPSLSNILRGTMLKFEDVFFGHHPLTRERFESCWGELDDFHRQVQEVAHD